MVCGKILVCSSHLTVRLKFPVNHAAATWFGCHFFEATTPKYRRWVHAENFTKDKIFPKGTSGWIIAYWKIKNVIEVSSDVIGVTYHSEKNMHHWIIKQTKNYMAFSTGFKRLNSITMLRLLDTTQPILSNFLSSSNYRTKNYYLYWITYVCILF